MAQFINSTQTLTYGSFIYLMDSSAANISVTIPQMSGDYEFYNLDRIDNTVNDLTVILDQTTLMSGEASFKIYNFSNVTIMSLNGVWYPVAGYTKNR